MLSRVFRGRQNGALFAVLKERLELGSSTSPS